MRVVQGTVIGLAVLLATGMVAAPGAGATGAGAGGPEARPPVGAPDAQVSVTALTGPVGQPLEDVRALDDRGQVVGTAATPLGDRGAVLWRRGRATPVAPWWAPWTTRAEPGDVSEAGQVVGTRLWPSASPPDAPPMTPFSWRNGVWVDLVAPGTGTGQAWAVNARGQVGSRSDSSGAGGELVAWQDGETIVAPPLAQGASITAADLNDRGTAVVGVADDAGPEAISRVVLWDIGGDATELDLDLPPGSFVESVGVNERGQVAVGASSVSSGQARSYLWDGEPVDLGDLELPATLDQDSGPLNDRGHLVGQHVTAGQRHAALWRDGEITDLGTLGGGFSTALAVNDRDEVVGYSTTASGAQHAFLWRDGRMTDLGALVPEGASRATQVNERGQVLGTVTRSDQTRRHVLWAVGRP